MLFNYLFSQFLKCKYVLITENNYVIIFQETVELLDPVLSSPLPAANMTP